MTSSRDARLFVLLLLMVSFQGYVALYHGSHSPDEVHEQEQVLLQHTNPLAPSRAHGEGDHQRFGGSADSQPSGLYQVNGPPPPGSAPGPQPPPNTAGLAAPPAPLGAPGPSLQGDAASLAPPALPNPGRKAGSERPPGNPGKAEPAKHQRDATEQLLLGVLYLESRGQLPLRRRQAQALVELLRRSEATKDVIPSAKSALIEVLTDEQRAFVEARRQENFQKRRPLPPEGMQVLLRTVLKRL